MPWDTAAGAGSESASWHNARGKGVNKFHSSTNRRSRNDTLIQEAISKIPTASLLYSATPLAASLSFQRPFMQLLVVALTVLVVFTQASVVYSSIPPPEPAQVFRFRPLRVRDGSPATAPNIKNFRILLNGSPIQTTHNQEIQGASLVLSFSTPVDFNGFAFDTTLSPVEMDPVIFYFEYERSGRWLVAGGSSPFYFACSLTFLPIRHGTCRPRGCTNVFRDLETGFNTYLETAHRWFTGGAQIVGLVVWKSLLDFVELQHKDGMYIYGAACLILFVQGVSRHMSHEYAADLDLQAQLLLLGDCVFLALDGSLLPTFLVCIWQYGTYCSYVVNFQVTSLVYLTSPIPIKG